MLPTDAECRKIAQRALGLAEGLEASVSLTFTRGSNTRFANNEITTSGEAESVAVVLAVTQGGRTGRVSLNETSESALDRALIRARDLAEILPQDPEYVGPLPPQRYAKIKAWDESTAAAAAKDRIAGVRAVIEPASKGGMNASGFFSNAATVQCVANTAGNFGVFRFTNASYSATVRTADGTGSGWAEDASYRIDEVDSAALAARALEKARRSAKPRPIDPADFTVILEPAALAGLMGFNFAGALSARAAEEGRSVFSKKGGGTRLGEKVLHESVTLRTDPQDARRPSSPWAVAGGGGGGGGGGAAAGVEPGLALRPTTWVEKGVLRNLSYDRYWAKKSGEDVTPPATALVLEGGTESMESLIASTERGLLVTNLWYIRVVNPQSMQVTGLTRDGLWLIEKGRIAHPVTNLRFNESPAVVLSNVLGMTPAVRSGNIVVPAVKASNFTFTSVSDAV